MSVPAHFVTHLSSWTCRYESEGLGFIDGNRNRLRKGPHNVSDMWSTYLEGIYCRIIPHVHRPSMYATAQTDEETAGEIKLDTNVEGYPIIPDDVMELQLQSKKWVIRKYMVATRSS